MRDLFVGGRSGSGDACDNSYGQQQGRKLFDMADVNVQQVSRHLALQGIFLAHLSYVEDEL